MVISRFFVVLFIFVFKTASCVSFGQGDRDARFNLLSLFPPTDDLPQVIKDPTTDPRNNFINGPSYLPPYKSKEDFRDDNYDYTKLQKGGFKNGFNKNSASYSKDENGFDGFRQAKKMNWYEVNEQGEHENKYYPPGPPLVRPIQAQPQFYPGQNYGFRPMPDFYQGFGLNYHHNYDFHNQHGPDCFGNQMRRPQSPSSPPTVAPPSTGAPVNINPTVAGIISTEAPGIDIRFGRDIRDREEIITFPK